MPSVTGGSAIDRTIFIRVDFGELVNHSAIVVLDRFDETPDYTDMLRGVGVRRRYIVRQAERLGLGTPYPVVVERAKRVAAAMMLRGHCVLVPDGTGVGVPVVEMMREVGMGCRVWPVVITPGQEATASHVPRTQLLTRMQMMAQRGELEIAAGCRHIEELKRELGQVGLKKGGELDDMAFALALACWRARVR